MGWGNLFRTDLHAIKNSVAAPHTLLAIYCLQDFFIPSVPWIHKKPKGLRQHGRSQELRICFKCRAGSETDTAEDAVDVGIHLFTFFFLHSIFHFRRDERLLEIRLDSSIVIKKSGHINDEVSNHREEGKGFDQGRFLQQVFNMGSAGKDIFAIDSHCTRSAHGSPARIAKREGPISFILNAEQSLQKIHPFPDFHLKSFEPLLGISLFVKTFDS